MTEVIGQCQRQLQQQEPKGQQEQQAIDLAHWQYTTALQLLWKLLRTGQKNSCLLHLELGNLAPGGTLQTVKPS